MAADHVPVGRIDLRTGPLRTAVLDLPGYRVVLGGFSPTTADLLSRIRCIKGTVALGDAGRYGPYWWIRLAAQGSGMALLAAPTTASTWCANRRPPLSANDRSAHIRHHVVRVNPSSPRRQPCRSCLGLHRRRHPQLNGGSGWDGVVGWLVGWWVAAPGATVRVCTRGQGPAGPSKGHEAFRRVTAARLPCAGPLETGYRSGGGPVVSCRVVSCRVGPGLVAPVAAHRCYRFTGL